MLADDDAGVLTAASIGVFTNNMNSITTTTGKVLVNYVTGLNADGTTKTGCSYSFAADATVTQQLPP